VQSGKDGKLRVLDIRKLNGRTGKAGTITGGEIQTLSVPGKTGVFTAPAVWRTAGVTWTFVATAGGTGAYRLSGRRLTRVWENGHAGTSPVLAGGLLFVYDPNGGLRVYRPATGSVLATLATGSGHWNSPIVAGARIALPEGDANDHSQTGVLDIWSLAGA
jgi:hypothetical protein